LLQFDITTNTFLCNIPADASIYLRKKTKH